MKYSRPTIAAAAGFAGTLLAPSVASACTQDYHPAPAAPFSDSVSGAMPHYNHQSYALDGCDTGEASGDDPGEQGKTGQDGGAVSVTLGNVTLTGRYASPSPGETVAVSVGTTAGSGGKGGQAMDSPGAGGVSGNGGRAALTFSGSIAPAAGLGLPTTGVVVFSAGGNGGPGGTAAGGQFGPTGGAGEIGGSGGDVTLDASGTIAAVANGLAAEAAGGSGGSGGNAYTYAFTGVTGGAGGAGGTGGSATVNFDSGTVAVTGAFTATRALDSTLGIVALSDGGDGNFGSSAADAANRTGGHGGVGGTGGAASATVNGTVRVVAPTAGTAGGQPVRGSAIGVLATSLGGSGGAGGAIPGGTLGAHGGDGGDGGIGGGTKVTLLPGAEITVTGSSDIHSEGSAGVFLQTSGGLGGAGGDAAAVRGDSGGGGIGGSGGTAEIGLNGGRISTSGVRTHGIVLQSIGGGGANAGRAAGAFSDGGGGGMGGDAGSVTANSSANGTITSVSGAGSTAMLAQSVGGGGGSGGNVTDASLIDGVAIGGNGGLGGRGAAVELTLKGGVFASLSPSGGGGIHAQSVGGAGGAGGSAMARSIGFFSYVVGGDAGEGARAGNVTVDSAALVTTYGDHATGIEAQSIGGGGGKGGAALSLSAGPVASVGVAIGGRGGGGGAAGAAAITNRFQVATFGPDAFGLKAQSVGGGGGSGGAAVASVVALSPNAEIPAVSASFSLGGSGGAGNTGGTASIGNMGLVTTAGHGSHAVFAQSVGGGGGNGGDSSAASYSGGAGGFSLDFGTAIGGSGGTGATGGAVNVMNSGLLFTHGQDAFGVFGQSVGGGGGSGGAGDTSGASAESEEELSISLRLAIGGTAGSGGTGGAVDITSSSGIVTLGDGADGVFGQSVGGGGGAGGGGVANANGGDLAIAVGVGGGGGNGGHGGGVTVGNSGGILTRGGDAPGITAQSVGGGGGRGGKGASTTGGAPVLQIAAIYEAMKAGLGLDENTEEIIEGVLEIGDGQLEDEKTEDDLREIAGELAKGEMPKGVAKSFRIGVTVGGGGGAAGAGGRVGVTNTGTLATSGAHSDGIVAQSVGGGGGMGGGANANSAFDIEIPIEASINLGGTGGAGGDGGAVTVANGTAAGSAGADIATAGAAAFGISAQSIGGGGGRGAMSGSEQGSLLGAAVDVGGESGTSGSGGTVTIASPGTITTTGRHAIGIFAQSVGGGGGLAKIVSQERIAEDEDDGEEADNFTPTFAFGRHGSGGGHGGAVSVTAHQVITQGRNAHGVLAQSVGGGGGLAVGGEAEGDRFFFSGAGGTGGAGGTVQADLTGLIDTSGAGAAAIFAQSVGGGGGIAGDQASSSSSKEGEGNTGAPGDGGNVTVIVQETGSIRTRGANAHGIIAQSVGGGGGHVTTADGIVRGTAGGAGHGGDITLNIDGPVWVTGAGSSGIKAQSDGTSRGKIDITVTSAIRADGGGASASAILLNGGSGNTITNSGLISGVTTAAGGYAILTDTAAANTTLTNSGRIDGALSFGGTDSTVENLRGGEIRLGRVTELGEGGRMRNAGTLSFGEIGRIAATEFHGHLDQTAAGRMIVDVHADEGLADTVDVRGHLNLEGHIEVNAITLARARVNTATVRDEFVLTENLRTTSIHAFSFTPRSSGNRLDIEIDADFAGAVHGRDRRSVAAYFQRIWDRGVTGFGPEFAAVSRIGSGDFDRAMDTLSGRGLSGIALGRLAASQRFAWRGDDCLGFVGDTGTLALRDCGSLRTDIDNGDRDGTSFQPDYSLDRTTVALGGQRQIAPGWFLGGSIGYERSTMRADEGAVRAEGDAVVAAVSVRRQHGPWLLEAALDAGYGWYDSRRRTGMAGGTDTAHASPRAWNAGLHLRAGRQYDFGDWYLQPSLGLDASYVRMNGFTETGAGAYNLRVSSSEGTLLAATPALQVGSRVDLEGGSVLHVWASGGVGFFSGNDWELDGRLTSLSGAGQFRTSLEGPDTVGQFRAGIDVINEGRVNVSLGARADTGSGWSELSGQLMVTINF